MDKINTVKDLANHFRGLADGSIQPFDTELGICNHIDMLIDEEVIPEGSLTLFDEILSIDQYYSSWDKFSGDVYYPVPSTDTRLTSADMYDSVYYSEDCNMWTGEYGNLRKDLCLHIAKELEKLIVVN